MQTFDHICIYLHCRCFKRHSRAALNRQQELSHLPVPPQLRLYDYLQKRKERKPAPVIDLKISKVGNVSSQTLDTLLWANKVWKHSPFLLSNMSVVSSVTALGSYIGWSWGFQILYVS